MEKPKANNTAASEAASISSQAEKFLRDGTLPEILRRTAMKDVRLDPAPTAES